MQSGTPASFAFIVLGLAFQAMPAQDSTSEVTIPLYGRHAEQTKQFQSTSTQTVKFSGGGLIRVTGSYGDLTIDGSDEPDVKIDVKKSTSYATNEKDHGRFDRVSVSPDLRSDSELAITIKARRGSPHLETHLRVPSNSKLYIHQSGGTVSISNMTADMDVHNSGGDIVVWLADKGRYAVDANSKFGTVASDLAGSPRFLLYRAGESFSATEANSAAHLRLRVGFGGITIKRLPPEAEPPSTQTVHGAPR